MNTEVYLWQQYSKAELNSESGEEMVKVLLLNEKIMLVSVSSLIQFPHMLNILM